MKLLIDNLDGRGAIDYSAAMAAEGAGVITRRLNASSSFRVTLLLAGTQLATPARRARVVVLSDDGTVLFTGYTPVEPERVNIGLSFRGDDALLEITADGDEWLLDQQGAAGQGISFGLSADSLLRSLTQRSDPERFEVSSAGTARSMGLFAPVSDWVWSKAAAAVASGTYAAYRVLGGAVSLLPGGAASHALSEDGPQRAGTLRLRAAKSLVNDVTVSGEKEPAAYVTEVFQGDGTTAQFQLSNRPFQPTGRSRVPDFAESFAATGRLATQMWSVADPGSHLQFGTGGLILAGGTGLDGQTTLTLQDALELGGSVTLEAAGIVLNAGSDGVLCGVYSGPIRRSNCLAGFDVRPSGGTTVVRALINGLNSGAGATLATGHTYTLRLRLDCVEMHRALQTFYTMVDGATLSFGGGVIPASVHAVLELLDLGLASNTPATVLFDGTLTGAVAIASFTPVNSVQLLGSVSAVRVMRRGPVLVSGTSGDGVSTTRLLGKAGEGADAELSGDRLTFFPGRVPAAGELLKVTYRATQRSVSRIQDDASIVAEGATGLPGSSLWTGHVTEPIARNSADCRAAAQALLSLGVSRTAAMQGEFQAENPDDIWPGDLLNIQRSDGTLSMMVRSVEIRDQLALPEVLHYSTALANDWADPLSIRVTPGVAADVTLPVDVMPQTSAPSANLSGVSLIAVSGSSLQLDMGAAPPTGGGFEVRRRDGAFAPGQDPDLVVRSAARGFSIPRSSSEEQLFVRAYDGSAVPVYSPVSAAIYIHVPTS